MSRVFEYGNMFRFSAERRDFGGLPGQLGGSVGDGNQAALRERTAVRASISWNLSGNTCQAVSGNGAKGGSTSLY